MIQALRPDRAAVPAIVADPQIVGAYLEDASGAPPGRCAGLVRVGDEAELGALLRATGTTPVLPQAARSSLTGGAIPHGEVVLTAERMDEIGRVERWPGGGRVRVQPGVRLSDLERHLADLGLYYPPVPTYREAMVGGTVATNAGGAASFKYGVTRHWVRALRVVLFNGDVVSIERDEHVFAPGDRIRIALSDGSVLDAPLPEHGLPPLKKISAGYHSARPLDLVDLFVGSEGTLGWISEVTLDLVPLPSAVLGGLVFLDDPAQALGLAGELRTRAMRARERRDSAGPDVRAIEWLDENSLRLLRRGDLPDRLALPPQARAALFFEMELPEKTGQAEAEDLLERMVDGRDVPDGPLPRLFGPLLSQVALERIELSFPGDNRGLERLRALREAVPTRVNEILAARRRVDRGVQKVGGDLIVPFGALPEMIEAYRDGFCRRGLEFAIWGHLSDGNLHPNAIPRDAAQTQAANECLFEFASRAQRLGGCPLSEHGVGRSPTKQALLRHFVGDDALSRMRAIKRGLDPPGRFAPGVLFAAHG